MKNTIIYLLLSIAIGFCSSEVISLTTHSFQDFIDNNDYVLAEFYAPWCGHCKALAPEYEKASSETHVPFVKVDCTENEELCSKYEVKGYPTLYFFKKGDNKIPYNGGRKVKDLVSFVTRKSQSVLTVLLTDEDVEAFALQEPAIIGFFNNDKEPEYQILNQIASKDEFEDLRFGVVLGASQAHVAKYKITGDGLPAIKLFREEESGEDLIYERKNDWPNTLASWLAMESLPLVQEIGPANFAKYVNSGKRILLGFLDKEDEDGLAANVAILRKLAPDYKTDFLVGYSDGKMFLQQAQRWGAQGNKLPIFITIYPTKDENIVFDENKFPTTKELRKWLDSIIKGEVKTVIKSDPIPIENDDAVYIAVGKTVKDIAYQANKDVLLEIYAPWCGHCKQLIPTYEKLAKHLETVESIQIVKINGETNQYAHIANGLMEGYPTLLLFRANHKVDPIRYGGDRSFEDLLKFLKDNADIPFTLPIVTKDEL